MPSSQPSSMPSESPSSQPSSQPSSNANQNHQANKLHLCLLRALQVFPAGAGEEEGTIASGNAAAGKDTPDETIEVDSSLNEDTEDALNMSTSPQISSKSPIDESTKEDGISAMSPAVPPPSPHGNATLSGTINSATQVRPMNQVAPPATPIFDAHRFEKISNIVKQFKLSCGKAQSQFQGMDVRNSKFTAFIDAFTANT